MLSPDFIKQWRLWLVRPVPVEIFRKGRTNSPAYEIEHDIDHSVSYVHGLVENLIAGKDFDFKTLAAKELAELEQLRARISDGELNNEDKEKYLDYLTGMKSLLEKVAQASE
jgi:hypothetical protein